MGEISGVGTDAGYRGEDGRLTAVEEAGAEEVVESVDGADFVDGLLDVVGEADEFDVAAGVIPPTVAATDDDSAVAFGFGTAIVEDDVGGIGVAVARLADGADVDHRPFVGNGVAVAKLL